MFIRFACLASALGLMLVVFSTAADPISRDQLQVLQGLIKPTAAEAAWAKIPWMTDLWEARKRAAAEGKPILLWEMDGHPLGCT
jgi:hypothetical protein